MKGVKIKTLKVRDREFEVYVDSAGYFCVDFDGETIEKPTLEDLKSRLMDLTKQKAGKIAIEFYRWVEDRWNDEKAKLKHGVITGLHAANDNVMVRFDGEKAEQDSRYYNSDSSFLRLTKEEVNQYIKLRKALEAAKKVLTDFEEAHTFDAKEEVRAIIAKTA